MYDICHPTYYNMSQLGCSDQVKLTTAFYVYMELCEVKRYYNVDYKYCESLQLFYLQAKRLKSSPLDIFVPWPAIHNVTLDNISNILHALDINKFTFVFKEGDTTSVYYNICSGIVKPSNPEESKELKQKENKKVNLEKEINRNTANLYERALSFDNDNTNKSGSDSEEFYTPMNSSNDQVNRYPNTSSDYQELDSRETKSNDDELNDHANASKDHQEFDSRETKPIYDEFHDDANTSKDHQDLDSRDTKPINDELNDHSNIYMHEPSDELEKNLKELQEIETAE